MKKWHSAISTLCVSPDSDSDMTYSCVSKEGWLDKRGETNKAFKRRYVKLCNDRLEYFNSPGSVDPNGCISLNEAKAQLVPGKQPGTHMLVTWFIALWRY